MYDVTRTPEVMTTDWKRSKTGLMAMEASMQLKCMMGLGMVGARSSNGSTKNVNPETKQKQTSTRCHYVMCW